MVTEVIKSWDTVLHDADLPANELVRLLVDVYHLPQDEAQKIVTDWLYSDFS